MESIPGLHKRLKIRAQICRKVDAYTNAVVVSGIYQNYRNGAVSNQLKDVGWWERGCWGGDSESVEEDITPRNFFSGNT